MAKIIGINSLMKHLRNHHSISIFGSSHKRKLKNYGYYHGYKGYRYIGSTSNRVPFSSFDEIVAFNNFDMELKSIFYPYIMFIETTLKNYVLDEVLIASKSNSFEEIFNTQVTYYKKYQPHENSYKKELQKRLRLRNQIYNVISRDYGNDKKVVKHFYHKDETLPIWAIFEIISMGEFGTFVACLDENTKQQISTSIELNQSCDSDRKLTERIIFLLKDLRNSIAHNDVIFDTRFKKSNTARSLKHCVELDTGITNITYDTIVDYFILTIYLLKKLCVSKTELKRTISNFEHSIDSFRAKIPFQVYSRIFYTDTRTKLTQLKSFI